MWNPSRSCADPAGLPRLKQSQRSGLNRSSSAPLRIQGFKATGHANRLHRWKHQSRGSRFWWTPRLWLPAKGQPLVQNKHGRDLNVYHLCATLGGRLGVPVAVRIRCGPALTADEQTGNQTVAMGAQVCPDADASCVLIGPAASAEREPLW